MSFFKKNTLSPDEMVDAVVFVTGMSLTSYFITGNLLTAMQRDQMWDKRKHLYQGSCSTLFKAKLTSLAKDIAKHIITTPEMADFFRFAYNKDSVQEEKDRANELLCEIVSEELTKRRLV